MASKFSDEKVLKILAEAKNTTVAALGKKYGFSEPTFYVWKKKFQRNVQSVDKASKSPYDEIQYLRRALGEALVENALLKQKMGL